MLFAIYHPPEERSKAKGAVLRMDGNLSQSPTHVKA